MVKGIVIQNQLESVRLDRRLLWGCFFLFLALSVFLLLRQLARSVEEAQFLTFPFILLSVFFYRQFFFYRLHLLLLILSGLAWMISGLNTRGYLPRPFSHEEIYITTLSSDPDPQLTRAIYRRYNEIAQTFGLPKMDFVQRQFGKVSDIADWFVLRPDVAILVAREADRLQFSINSRIFHVDDRILSVERLPSNVISDAKKWGVDLNQDAFVLVLSDFKSPLIFATAPDILNIRYLSTEVSLHYLAWLTKGISVRKYQMHLDEFSSSEGYARVFDALAEAMRLIRYSNVPALIGVTHFLSAKFRFLEALEGKNIDQNRLREAIDLLGRTMTRISPKYNPELYAAVLNNLAIFYLLQTDKFGNQGRRVREVLWRAAQILDRQGVPVKAARVAVMNLAMLEVDSMI